MRRFLIVVFALILAACGGGALYSPPGVDYYDFKYLEGGDRQHALLASGAPFEMAFTFVWGGAQGEPVAEPQHAIVAFMQATSDTGPRNGDGHVSPTNGAGAFVGERGLELEVWHRETPDSATNGIVWNQDTDRCARDVLGTVPPKTQCLADQVGDADYITPAPAFQLRKGVRYTLKVRVQRVGELARVEAELYRTSAFGPELLQRGKVHAPFAKHFPAAELPVRATVARTPGEPVIFYEWAGR